jgi:hypothetical protein
MKRIILTFIVLTTMNLSFAQDADSTVTEPSKWKLQATYGLNGTQSSFVNWAAGGRNNISVLGYIEASAKYSKNRVNWDTDLGLSLGGMMYLGKGESDGLQKTDDRIDLATKVGYKLKDHWYFSALAGFKSQFLDGFTFPNDSIRVSKFMAPGYGNLSLGIDYVPNDKFSLFVSPLSAKLTFVQDEVLSNAGAFGVTAAEYDLTTGDVISNGKRFRGEFGAYLKVQYNQTIAKNIELKTKLELFSNYLEKPQNIDVNAEVIMNFKVNSWFSASINWLLIYDDDIKITDRDGNVGPRTQFKSVIGLGIAYTMKNFKE